MSDTKSDVSKKSPVAMMFETYSIKNGEQSLINRVKRWMPHGTATYDDVTHFVRNVSTFINEGEIPCGEEKTKQTKTATLSPSF